MPIKWCRLHHGASTDLKWLVLSKQAGIQPGIIWAVFGALLDYASQAEIRDRMRGDVSGFDVKGIAEFYGFTEEQVTGAISVMRSAGVIVGDRLAAWEKRQPKYEDPDAAKRQANKRKRDQPGGVTASHAESHIDSRLKTPDSDLQTQESQTPDLAAAPVDSKNPRQSETNLSLQANPLQESAEEQFWALASPAAKKGISQSHQAQLLELCGDFDSALAILRRAMGARSPGAYIGKVITDMKAHQVVDNATMVPEIVCEWRQQGCKVTRHVFTDGSKGWEVPHGYGSYFYDDDGAEVDDRDERHPCNSPAEKERRAKERESFLARAAARLSGAGDQQDAPKYGGFVYTDEPIYLEDGASSDASCGPLSL